ncbi:hypothetical protein HOLleu_06918 [Holothuria leucospilota]|uniref:Uncharacterized protein n=1 Tax=Holothuria leucospilota TaxID=206669 RepID=A0A9Q1CM35_HOLLE|nr:hypothetical protein HOLleu_06918 [Holothuria leucospilota]
MVKDHLRSPEVKKQNFPRIPNIVIWGHQRSKSKISQEFQSLLLGSPEVKKQISQEFPRSSSEVTSSQKAKFLNNSQDCHGVTRCKKARIPKSVIWGHKRSESKISREFPRSSSGVTRGQKAKFPKNFQDPRSAGGQRSSEVKDQMHLKTRYFKTGVLNTCNTCKFEG